MPVSRSSSPSPPATPSRRRLRSCARRCERGCCTVATYFPLAFVYGLTTWAVWVEASIGFRSTTTTPQPPLFRRCVSIVGILLYILLNTCYTIAVFTDPGSPQNSSSQTTRGGKYSILPTNESDHRVFNTVTVSSTGAPRYCKKCQHPKPDRTHHCSTCRRCVLKMDHHCPWLSTCLGLHNYKSFILFLTYTSIFCWICFVGTARWVWIEVFESRQYMSEFAPVSVIILAILSGIIGLVITGFTVWHIYLCTKGQTTIECLEKTRYLSGVRKRVEQNRRDEIQHKRNDSEGGIKESLQRAGGQLLEIHANAVPGALRYEEGEEHTSPTPTFSMPSRQPQANSASYSDFPTRDVESPAQLALRRNYSHYEADRETERYNEYLDEQETSAMPNAFDLGWKRNLLHLFGPNPWFWFLPVCNTTGDGWNWEVSEKWRVAAEEVARRKEQRLMAVRTGVPVHAQETGLGGGGTGGHYNQARQYAGSYDDEVVMHENDSTPMQTFRKQQYGRRQKRDFDMTGEGGEIESFEVSDSSGDDDDDNNNGNTVDR